MDPAAGSRSPALTPEDQLRLELSRRMKARKRENIRKRQSFPIFPAICVVVAICTGSVGYFRPDLADRALSHIDVGIFGRANAAEPKAAKAGESAKPAEGAKAEAKSAETAGANAEKDAAPKGEAKDEKVANIRNWTPEELSFFNKLNDRKKELDLREAELNKLEEELQKQKNALDERIKQLETMRAQISQTLKTRVATDQQKVDKLVDFYSTMKPQQAAKVIETLNEDLAIEVIDKMKKKNAAEILNAMDAKKARRLSELITGYQRTPASTANDSSGDEKENAAP
jgi:flagellar motility protein MotE (MotC chaperone)